MRTAVSKADAIAYFTAKGDPYKLDLLDGLEDGTITFYQQGGFTDLCRGPAHSQHRLYQSGQAHQRLRRVLARRRERQAAHAHLRHHVPQSGRS